MDLVGGDDRSGDSSIHCQKVKDLIRNICVPSK